ncbi:hypothetical protein BHE74_00030825 [Ensete ventricosum]|nr:hypothetical protein GW17_00035861 [Ensete ventricosum]RWW62072.1 hypothetical protein BHE74_00030825 [Ensete ventricosum]RZS15433.1 hypothetical protein BHM03_00047276 [Ensete ventricosum]
MVESLSESSRHVSGRRCSFNVGGVAGPSPVELLASSSAFPSAMSPSGSYGYPHTFISHLSLSLSRSYGITFLTATSSSSSPTCHRGSVVKALGYELSHRCTDSTEDKLNKDGTEKNSQSKKETNG